MTPAELAQLLRDIPGRVRGILVPLVRRPGALPARDVGLLYFDAITGRLRARRPDGTDVPVEIQQATTTRPGYLSAADYAEIVGALPDASGGYSGTTTDGTTATLGSYTPTDGHVSRVDVMVVASSSSGGVGASWHLSAVFRRAVLTTTLIGSVGEVVATAKDGGASAWAADLDASGPAVRVRVTGAAATTVRWRATYRVVSVAP